MYNSAVQVSFVSLYLSCARDNVIQYNHLIFCNNFSDAKYLPSQKLAYINRELNEPLLVFTLCYVVHPHFIMPKHCLGLVCRASCCAASQGLNLQCTSLPHSNIPCRLSYSAVKIWDCSWWAIDSHPGLQFSYLLCRQVLR